MLMEVALLAGIGAVEPGRQGRLSCAIDGVTGDGEAYARPVHGARCVEEWRPVLRHRRQREERENKDKPLH